MLRGHARLIRYADDLGIGFRNREEADEVLEAMRKRVAAYGLTLHPDKTRIVRFGRPGSHEPKAETFEFLGFTITWDRVGNYLKTFPLPQPRISVRI